MSTRMTPVRQRGCRYPAALAPPTGLMPSVRSADFMDFERNRLARAVHWYFPIPEDQPARCGWRGSARPRTGPRLRCTP